MSKSAINDITTRQLTMILHARNHVDLAKEKSSASPQHTVPHEGGLLPDMLLYQALVDILMAKGVFTREELLERIQELGKSR